MQIPIPKFHDKTSLLIGVIGGALLTISAAYNIKIMGLQNIVGNALQLIAGIVLAVHCLDMVKYYKKHRIIRIVKTENHRVIHKESVKNNNKLECFYDALVIGWNHKTFRLWLVLCTMGIIIGILAGIGMTQLVLLVAIACIGWGMEMANTGIEKLMDMVQPQYSEKVKVVKDLFGAVPIFVYSAYIISWMILVIPALMDKLR